MFEMGRLRIDQEPGGHGKGRAPGCVGHSGKPKRPANPDLAPEHAGGKLRQAREHFGSTEYPVWVVVKKTREVYMHLGVRIHVDHVAIVARGIMTPLGPPGTFRGRVAV